MIPAELAHGGASTSGAGFAPASPAGGQRLGGPRGPFPPCKPHRQVLTAQPPRCLPICQLRILPDDLASPSATLTLQVH